MSSRITEEVEFLDGIDYTELRKFGDFTSVTVSTGQVDPNSTVQFETDTSDPIIESLDIFPTGGELPDRARLIGVKVNVRSGSTDSDVKIFQSSSYDEIEQVVSIVSLDQSSTPETYILGSGIGTPFINKEEESMIYVEVSENSGSASEYDIEIYWLDIPL